MLVQIVPLRFFSYRYKKERSVAFKICQNPFSAGALPRTPLGSSRRSPRPSSRLERGHSSPYPTPFGTDPPSAPTMHPPLNSSQIYTYAVGCYIQRAAAKQAFSLVLFCLQPVNTDCIPLIHDWCELYLAQQGCLNCWPVVHSTTVLDVTTQYQWLLFQLSFIIIL